MNKLAFIGGTGVYDVGILHNIEEKSINTPYGKAHYQKGLYENKEIKKILANSLNKLNLDVKLEDYLDFIDNNSYTTVLEKIDELTNN